MPKRPGSGKSTSKSKTGLSLTLTESESQATSSAAVSSSSGGHQLPQSTQGREHRLNHSISKVGVKPPNTPGHGHGHVGGLVGPSERPQMLVVSCRFSTS